MEWISERLWIDVPENALSFFTGMWTGAGEWFYIYRKNDTELVIMNHPFKYGKELDEQEEYKEILSIPLEKGNKYKLKS